MSQRLYQSVYRAHQAVSHAFETELAKAGLDITASQHTVLEAIKSLDSPSQHDIVRVTGIDRSTMTDIVRRLSRKGLITRKRARTDARRYDLTLTAVGRVTASKAAVIANRFEARLSLRSPGAMKGLESKLAAISSAARGEDALMAAE